MNEIAKEFCRANRTVPVRFAVVWAICAAVLFFTGAFGRDNTRVPAIVVCAFLGVMTARSAIEIIAAPRRFRKRLKDLPKDSRGEILSGFSSVPSIGRRWFYGDYLLFFTNRRIELVAYGELESADLKRNRLYLKLIGGKTLPLPFEASENPAVLVAAIRSKNGKLKASIDGRPVDFDKKKKGKEEF